MKINFQDNFTWKEILKIDDVIIEKAVKKPDEVFSTSQDNHNQYSTYDKNGYLQSANKKSTLSILA